MDADVANLQYFEETDSVQRRFLTTAVNRVSNVTPLELEHYRVISILF